MICPLRSDQQKLFSKVCSFEHVFGSRALASLQLYGLTDTRHSFYLSLDAAGRPDAALPLNGDVLTIVTIGGPPIEELAAFVKQKGAVEIDSTLEQDTRLQKILGGEIESSFFMEYPFSEPPAVPDGEIALTQDAKALYQVLCRSHEYYRDHLEYEPWAADLEKRWQAGAAQTILLTENGCPVATVFREQLRCRGGRGGSGSRSSGMPGPGAGQYSVGMAHRVYCETGQAAGTHQRV